MTHVVGQGWSQTLLLPELLDDYVGVENPELYRSSAPMPDLSRLTVTRTVAMKIRLETPSIFSVWRLLQFFAEIGLPTFFDTPAGFAPGHPASLEKRMKKQDYNPSDPDWQRFGIVTSLKDPDGEHVTVVLAWYSVCFPGQGRVAQDTLPDLSKHDDSTPMACPLATGRFLSMPCDGRRPECKKIEVVPGQLPPRPGCIARALYEAYIDELE